MKKLYIFLIAVFIFNIATAQMTNYTTSNSGLLSNNISSIVIDSQGNKWFANFESGVTKFDDNNWTTYTHANSGLISQFVHTMAIDAMDNKWIGTWEGLSKFDGTNWTSYTTADGLSCNDILSIAIDALGNKWIGTDKGLSKYNDTTWTNYTIFNSPIVDSAVYAIAIDNLGNKWLGTAKGVSKFDGVNWTTYLSGVNIISIAVDTQNNVWAGTGMTNQGVQPGAYLYDGITWTNYNGFCNLADSTVIAIAIDSQNNKWLGTAYGGVSKFDGTNWTTYDQNSGLTNNTVKAIAFDNLGNKWFGTYYGVSVLSNCGIAPVENICYVEFDSATTKNSINWANNFPVNVDSIKIYVEVSTNVWSLIGSAPSIPHYFIDLNSNPYSQSYSYKITTIDTCGQESDYSSSHTTITLLAAYDQGSNSYGFTWSAYQGLPVANYLLYGIMSNGTLTLIGSVPGNQYFFNYSNPFAGFIHYFVGFHTPTCGDSKTNYLVKSNWVQLTTNINELTDITNLIKTYPNPANDIITIESTHTGNQDFIVSIKDIQGQELLNEKVNFTTTHSLNVSSLRNGIYFLTLQNEKENYLSKIVIQR